MAFSESGDLFVATGDQGEIHRVTPAGAGIVFFKTEETHARSLAIDANDNLIVGTDPSGLILRITPAGEGFVLYQAPKREITAVAVAPDGTIYAAGVGNKADGARARAGATCGRSRSQCGSRVTARASHALDASRRPLPEDRKFIASKPTGIREKSGATRRTWSTRWPSTREDASWPAPAIMAIFTGWKRITSTRGC